VDGLHHAGTRGGGRASDFSVSGLVKFVLPTAGIDERLSVCSGFQFCSGFRREEGGGGGDEAISKAWGFLGIHSLHILLGVGKKTSWAKKCVSFLCFAFAG
jgi:hypothetical protein